MLKLLKICEQILSLLLLFVFLVSCKEKIDVIKISNVDFPMSNNYAATFPATYEKEIPEFTVCMRFLLESYNNNLFVMINAQGYYLDRIGWETGMERDGVQGGVLFLQRVVPERGVGGGDFPTMHHYNIQRNIATSKEKLIKKRKIFFYRVLFRSVCWLFG